MLHARGHGADLLQASLDGRVAGQARGDREQVEQPDIAVSFPAAMPS
jgi:hypothetical protein